MLHWQIGMHDQGLAYFFLLSAWSSFAAARWFASSEEIEEAQLDRLAFCIEEYHAGGDMDYWVVESCG